LEAENGPLAAGLLCQCVLCDFDIFISIGARKEPKGLRNPLPQLVVLQSISYKSERSQGPLLYAQAVWAAES
jgi:hypothetical protein